jgi:ketosteroid isomerase-like protein
MNSQEKTIQRFYESFIARDAEGMAKCYHPEVVFSDPVFGRLSGAEATGMWRMLCARAQGLAITFSSVSASGDSGSAHWEATYTFSKTGRRVHNVDRFNLWKWAGMALGPAGILLGWTPMVRGAVRKEARKGLAEFLQIRR